MVRPSPLRAMLLRTAAAARGPLPAALILSVAAVACGRVEAAGRGHRAISGAEKATTSRPGALPADTPAVPAQWRFPLHPPITTAPHAMVVTDAPLATHVGVEVLRAGGNAVDAAVATAFALAVVYPEAGNLGGGGFLVLRMADGRRAALDFREKAPLSASRDMYLDAQGNPTRASLEGWLASGVPGSVRGLWAAQRKYGSLPWARVVAPAIRLAEDGFPVDAHLHASLAAYQARLSLDSAAVAILYPGGEPAVAKGQGRFPGHLPIPLHDLRALDAKLTHLSRGEDALSVFQIHDARQGVRVRDSRTARFPLPEDGIAVGSGRGFRESVPLGDPSSGQLFKVFENLEGKGGGAAQAHPQAGNVIFLRIFLLGKSDKHGGNAGEKSGPVALDILQGPFDFETGQDQHGGGQVDGQVHGHGHTVHMEKGEDGQEDFLPFAGADGPGGEL